MELRTLRYFLAVAEELHFGRAARRVNIAQPPLSQQIRRLEAELGVQLFVRSKRRVSLTPQGTFLVQAARLLLRQADAAVAGVRAAAEGLVGHLALGLINAITFQGQAFSVLREFRKRYPGIAITLKVLTSVEQVRAIRQGDIDIGLLRLPIHDRSVTTEPLLTEELLAALPRTHRLARAKCVRLGDLADDDFVTLPGGTGFGLFEQTMALCREAGFTPRVTQDASELQTLSGLVAAGFGVALIPSSARRLPRPDVVYRPLLPTETVTIGAAYATGALQPVGKAFLDLLRTAMPVR
jgi:DNA-binding transcriptional LysR family regulator